MTYLNNNQKRKNKVKVKNEIKRLKILLNYYKCSEEEKSYLRLQINNLEKELNY